MPTPSPAGRRQAVLEGADVVLVHRVRLEVAGRLSCELRLEPPALLRRIVELAEGVGHLEAADVQLEALDGVGIVGALLRERRHLRREIVDERRLDERLLVQPLEDLRGDLAGLPRRRDVDAELPRQRGGASRVAADRRRHRRAERAAAASRAPSRSDTRRYGGASEISWSPK